MQLNILGIFVVRSSTNMWLFPGVCYIVTLHYVIPNLFVLLIGQDKRGKSLAGSLKVTVTVCCDFQRTHANVFIEGTSSPVLRHTDMI